MAASASNLVPAITNTGPLISIFQSESIDIAVAVFGRLHTTDGCLEEVKRHGWEQAVVAAGQSIVSHRLMNDELLKAADLATRIAEHAPDDQLQPNAHIGEAEVIALAQRKEFREAVLLLDELAARYVASELKLNVSGFAGMLLLATDRGLITAEETKERLERCRQQGTHYGATFIEQVYERAKKGRS